METRKKVHCEHDDYRAQWQAGGSYRAVCEVCGHDAGVVDLSQVTVIYGTARLAEDDREKP